MPSGSAMGLGSLERRELSRLWAEPGAWQLERDDDLEVGSGSSSGLGQASENRWGHMVHRIRAGDTLYDLSLAYYGEVGHWRAIYQANRATLESPEQLTPGQRLYLPTEPLRKPSGQFGAVRRVPDYYIVAPGDTLSSISEKILGSRNRCPAILEANEQNIPDPDNLEVGTVLVMPMAE